MFNSLGIVEVVGMLGAIEACDAAVKSANVELVGYELTRGGGMVTITLTGDVGAINAAVAAAVASAERVTTVVSHTVIARPSKELKKIIKDTSVESEDKPVEPKEETEKVVTVEKVPVKEEIEKVVASEEIQVEAKIEEVDLKKELKPQEEIKTNKVIKMAKTSKTKKK